MAQLVERDLAKVEAAGSSPVSRSRKKEESVERLVLFFDPEGVRGAVAK